MSSIPDRSYQYRELRPGGVIRLLRLEQRSDKIPENEHADPRQNGGNEGGDPDGNLQGDVKKRRAQPRRRQRPLIGSFIEMSLDSPQEYEALSYTWGVGPKDKTIRIQQGNLIRKFRITESLEVALKRLRYKDGDRLLWVDQLCINQLNDREKSKQVNLMSRIYQLASTVCVWLGPEDKEQGSERVMRLMQKMLTLKNLDRLVTNCRKTGDWESFAYLMRREWFSRRWVVQEIALARRAIVYCGTKKIDWSEFADAVALYEERSNYIAHLIKPQIGRAQRVQQAEFQLELRAVGASCLVRAITNVFRRSTDNKILERRMNLETLMSILLSFEATDGRDVIYAILALAKDTCTDPESLNNPRIIPDYNKSKREVYEEFIHFAVKSSTSLDIICVPWAPPLFPNMDHGVLPSWIPQLPGRAFMQEWTGDQKGRYARVNPDCLAVSSSGRKFYCASGRSVVDSEFRIEYPSRMFVRGERVAKINILGAPATSGIIPYNWLKLSSKADKQFYGQQTSEAQASQNSSNEIAERALRRYLPGWRHKHIPLIGERFWRTLVADRNFEGESPPSWYKMACEECFTRYPPEHKGHNVVTVGINIPKRIEKAYEESENNSEQIQFLRRVEASTFNKRFLVTSEHGIGLAPESAHVDDWICLLYDCSVPVILRRCEMGGWNFIGECYVHGIMDGERFDVKMHAEGRGQEFELM